MEKSCIDQSTQKENNLSVVLRTLLSNEKCCTRIQLTRDTGLAQATVTKITAQLIEWGMVSEQETIGTGVGRKAVRLHLNAGNYRVVAVRINRHYMTGAVYDMKGHVYDAMRCDISSEEGASHSFQRLIQEVNALIARSEVPVMGIGVAVPGPFNYITGRITLMSGFPGWNEIDIRGTLHEVFKIPVFVEQDANCGALAELWHARGEPISNMLFITADRGIGAGLILNSTVYRGEDGFAGELGHSSINIFGPRCECGNRGCLELYGSAAALENAYHQDVFDPVISNVHDTRVSASRILELVRQGDPIACRAYKKTVGYLCFGLVGSINTLNPDTIVFADRMINGGDLFLETANATFRQYLMPEIFDKLRVKICDLDGDPMLLGASVAAYDQMLETPSKYFRP